jgi:hypothetical protein
VSETADAEKRLVPRDGRERARRDTPRGDARAANEPRAHVVAGTSALDIAEETCRASTPGARWCVDQVSVPRLQKKPLLIGREDPRSGVSFKTDRESLSKKQIYG